MAELTSGEQTSPPTPPLRGEGGLDPTPNPPAALPAGAVSPTGEGSQPLTPPSLLGKGAGGLGPPAGRLGPPAGGLGSQSFALRHWRRGLGQNKAAILALALLALVVVCAVFAPLLAPQDATRQALSRRLAPPVWLDGGLPGFILGTDQLGRDILSRIIFGARVSLGIGLVTVALSALIGVTLGIITGFYGGWVDDLISRLIDIQLAIPYMLLAIALVMIIGPSIWGMVLVLALYGWTTYARVVRAEALSIREREYIQAARAVGVRQGRIMLRHIFPNVVSPIIILATLELANIIIFEASLSFLGLGVQPPTPSWGSMLADSRDYLPVGVWWLATFPGLAISLTILAINVLGDWLRDMLDPRYRRL